MKVADPAPRDPDYLWAMTAVNAELDILANLPDENINRPGSVFSICLIKLASVIKGSGSQFLAPYEILRQVKYVCRVYSWLRPREIDRQWKRAMRTAVPRYRQQRTAKQSD